MTRRRMWYWYSFCAYNGLLYGALASGIWVHTQWPVLTTWLMFPLLGVALSLMLLGIWLRIKLVGQKGGTLSPENARDD